MGDGAAQPVPVGALAHRAAAGRTIGDDDIVIALHPRNRDVVAFIDRVRPAPPPRVRGQGAEWNRSARAPYPPVRVGEAFGCSRCWRLSRWCAASLICSNVDVIRNSSFSWSPMSAAEIATKTGIEQRRYTSREPELALAAAKAALAKSGRSPAEIGAVAFGGLSVAALKLPMFGIDPVQACPNGGAAKDVSSKERELIISNWTGYIDPREEPREHARDVRGPDRDQRHLQRRHQRQRRVLRQGQEPDAGLRADRPRHDRHDRLDGRADDQPRLHPAARQGERQATSTRTSSRRCRACPGTRSASTRRPGSRA